MIVLIPSYEPNESLIDLITKLKEETDYTVLVVDDGSDETYSHIFRAAQERGCIVLRHPINAGKGAALKTGFAHIAQEYSGESVVCADSDGQHRIEDIIRVADAIDQSRNEMVLGCRQFDGKIPVKSRVGNSITAFLFGAITKTPISDTQTGLRGYPYSMLGWLLSVEGARFEYELNLLLKAKEAGIAIKQIPILTIYENDNKGTHFHPVKDSIRVYLPLFKFSLSSFLSGILDFTLLFVFQAMTGSLFLGVAIARAISSVFNYTVNRHLVFKSKGVSKQQSALKYFSLVMVIMLLNYCLLAFLSGVLRFPTAISKILVELILFILSYLVQKRLIFIRKRTSTHKRAFLMAKFLSDGKTEK